jgi:glycosyltransferase involved in cell wall biosynthesis
MSHIAIDARIINSSTGTYVERLLHYLQKVDKKNQYSVLVRKKDKDYWQPSNKNFSVFVAEFDNYSFAEQTGFLRFLNKLSPDLVHFCMPQQPILYKGKSITTFHDLTLLEVYNSDKNWFIFHVKQLVGKYVFKRVAKKSDHILTPSRFTKQSLLSFVKIPAKKVTVTYEASEVTPGKLTSYSHGFDKFIIYVGSQSDYKNIRRLGDAHQELIKKRPNLGLILIGNKNDSALATEKYFNKKGYKNILFTGFLPNEQRDWLYTKAEAYVFPSLLEGFGLPALEAMGYGAPVVSSNTSCLPEVYGDSAHYFDPRDTKDMARAIEEVISNPKLRQELIKKGYKQQAKYSWERMAKQTHQAYMDVLKD